MSYLCQDRITSIFSLIKRNFQKNWKQTFKRILNVNKNLMERIFFSRREKKVNILSKAFAI